jgi:hydrogenase-4 component F
MKLSPAFLAEMLLLLPLSAAALVWLPTLWRLVSRRRPAPAGTTGRRPVGTRIQDRLQDYATAGTSVLSTALTLTLAATARGPQRFPVLDIHMYVDSLSIYFLLLVGVVAMMASFYIGPYLSLHHQDTPPWRRALFYSLFNLFHLTMVLVPMVANLVILWMGIELTTVTSTALIVVEGTRRHFEAAWKYIVITSTGIIFALLGTLFLASAIPAKLPHASLAWPSLVPIAHQLNPSLVRLSFLFVLIGYGTKAGLAPMHTWLPDAHGEAAYPVSALLSGVLLKSALYVILRFIIITNSCLGNAAFTSNVMLIAGLMSVVFATPLILKRSPLFKRVLAYHSLEHMGIITVGIGIGGPIALFGALLHVLNHGVTKSLMFLGFGNVQDQYPARAASTTAGPDGRPGADEGPVGVIRAMPATGWMLALGGLALVGSPPFSIFLSEFIILWGGFQRLNQAPSAWLIVSMVLFVLSITLIFCGLVRHLGKMLLGDSGTRPIPESFRRILPLLLLALLVVLLGFTVPAIGPFNLGRLLHQSVTIVCQGGCQR